MYGDADECDYFSPRLEFPLDPFLEQLFPVVSALDTPFQVSPHPQLLKGHKAGKAEHLKLLSNTMAA